MPPSPADTGYRLRPATRADRAAIESVVFDVLAEYGLRPDPAGTDADLGDIEAHYYAAGGCFDVLLDPAGRVVGTVGLMARSPGVCELRKMYLRPDHRGRGLGRRLMEHALRRAAERGFTRMELETASVLREAIRLYESFGFRRFQPSHLAQRCDLAYFRMIDAARPTPQP
jgi:GNAT superfamily N-acetyltransferase